MNGRFGHVRQRGKSSYAAYWYEAGEQRYQGRFPTEDDAWTFLVRKAAELTYGISVEPTQLTVGQYLDLWLAGKHDITSGTRKNYHGMIEHAIKPGIGGVRLQELTTPAVRAWLNQMFTDGGRSTSYVRACHTLIKAALDDAADEQLVRRNPARSRTIRLPKYHRGEIQVWDEDEVQRFLAHIAGHPRFALYRLLIAAQLRIGEAVSIQWRDIDLSRQTLRVRRTFDYVARVVKDHPKSAASVRTIDLDTETVQALIAHRDRQQFNERRAALPVVSDLVFPNRNGGPFDPNTITVQLHKLCHDVGLPDLSPHDLRHTGATLLLKAGVPIHVVSRRLGHASIQITLDYYAHVLPAQQLEAASSIAEVMDGTH